MAPMSAESLRAPVSDICPLLDGMVAIHPIKMPQNSVKNCAIRLKAWRLFRAVCIPDNQL